MRNLYYLLLIIFHLSLLFIIYLLITYYLLFICYVTLIHYLLKATVPFGIMREVDGSLVHLTAVKGDVFAILSDPRHDGLSPSCIKLSQLAQDAIDRWPYSGMRGLLTNT